MIHFNNLSDLHRSNNAPLPRDPMLSLLHCTPVCESCAKGFTGDFYTITNMKMKSGEFIYGRTKYDHQSGSMYFTKPRQTVEMKNLELEDNGFAIWFHEDYLIGHPLHQEIKKYSYFNYELSEALHISPAEEQLILELYQKIENEYNNNQDEFTKNIILGHIDSILQYVQRFYKRQFLHRKVISGTTVTKFNEALSDYFNSEASLEKGLPTVTFFAETLKMSPRYLSDLLKQETGKTAMELMHIFLIHEAKNRLSSNTQNIAEIAYALGFEHPNYFSRVFKKETGVSPKEFKKLVVSG